MNKNEEAEQLKGVVIKDDEGNVYDTLTEAIENVKGGGRIIIG